MTLKTLRARFLLIPGELAKSENRPTLKLPANFLFKGTFEYAVKNREIKNLTHSFHAGFRFGLVKNYKNSLIKT